MWQVLSTNDGGLGDDRPNMVDNDTPIDMSGGMVRIGFHGNWAVSKNYVRVETVEVVLLTRSAK